MILKTKILTGVAGFSQVSSASLLGVKLLKVKREGVGHFEISFASPWTAQEYKFQPSGGLIIFQEPINPGEKVYVLYKK